MSNFIRICLVIILCAVFNSCASFIIDRGYITKSGVLVTVKHRGVWVKYPALSKRKAIHLPSICAPYLSDGTEQWSKCMRVERK